MLITAELSPVTHLDVAGQVIVHHVLVRGWKGGQWHGRVVEGGGRGAQGAQTRPEHGEAGPDPGRAPAQLSVHIREEVWGRNAKLDSWHHFVFQNTFQFEKRQESTQRTNEKWFVNWIRLGLYSCLSSMWLSMCVGKNNLDLLMTRSQLSIEMLMVCKCDTFGLLDLTTLVPLPALWLLHYKLQPTNFYFWRKY